MIFLLVLLALFILYSFFFDKNNKSSYKKAAPKSRILIRQYRVDRSFEGNRNRSRTDGKPPNLRRYAPESAACHEPDAPKRKKIRKAAS